MNIGDTIRAQGLAVGLTIDAEAVKVAGRMVSAIVDRQPRDFEMMDAGYADKEPISLEVAKGVGSSVEVAWVGGRNIPSDLRGYTPKGPGENGRGADVCVVNGANRTIRSVKDAGSAWILMTVKAT